MTKLHAFLLTSFFIAFHAILPADNTRGVYYSELKAFKKDPRSRMIFDEYVHYGLSQIYRDIEVGKNTTWLQAFIASCRFGQNVVIVTEKNMPHLYGYVQKTCQDHDIEVPAIFITKDKVGIGALATKILKISGAILLGQKLLHDFSDDTIEGVIAHELGHIKYNHINKKMALSCVSLTIASYLAGEHLESLVQNNNVTNRTLCAHFLYCILLSQCADIVVRLFEGKRFEKEADAFACRDVGKAAGLIKYFEFFEQYQNDRDNDFIITRDMLTQHKEELADKNLYYGSLLSYYTFKIGHLARNAWSYMYYNTFYGPHPSNASRIEEARKYLDQSA